MSDIAKETSELAARLEQLNNDSDDREIFELVTRTEVLLQQNTDEQEPFLK